MIKSIFLLGKFAGFFLFLFLSVTLWVCLAQAGEPVFEAVDIPAQKFFTGEKLVYQIKYLGIPVGEGVAEVREITTVRGHQAYHVIVNVRSYPSLDLLYKVRDEHHSFIDVRSLSSLEYHKNIKEGRREAEETIEFDQEKQTAVVSSKKHKENKTVPTIMGVQDQLSCGYWFRTLKVAPQSSVKIPVYADEKNWNVEVKIGKTKEMRIKNIGVFQAVEAEPVMPFEGIFGRSGRIRGWISLDERRIPLKMKVKIPVLGHVTAELSSYEAGKAPA